MITMLAVFLGLLFGLRCEGFSWYVLYYSFAAGAVTALCQRWRGASHGWLPAPPPPGTVFVSYRRGQHSRLARRVAEALYSQGIGVWMDEYKIALLGTLGHKELTRVLREGVHRCGSALIIADGGWGQSTSCRDLEGKPICDSIPAEKIIVAASPEVRLDPAVVGPLGQLPHRSLHPIPELIAAVAKNAGFDGKINLPPTEPAKVDRFSYHGFDFQLNVGGWMGPHESRAGTAWPHRYYECEVGTDKLSLGLCCGALSGRIRTPRPDDALVSSSDSDEFLERRRFYEGIKSYADSYIKSDALDGWKLAGVHLFHFANRAQLAFTYRKPSGWYRRYPITMDFRGGHYEFDFLFIWGGSFREFCKYAWMMDDMVESFQYSYRGR